MTPQPCHLDPHWPRATAGLHNNIKRLQARVCAEGACTHDLATLSQPPSVGPRLVGCTTSCASSTQQPTRNEAAICPRGAVR